MAIHLSPPHFCTLFVVFILSSLPMCLPSSPLLPHLPLSVALLFIAMSSQGSAATKAFSCCHYNYSLHTSTHTRVRTQPQCLCVCTFVHTRMYCYTSKKKKKKGELFLPLALLSIKPTSHPPTPSSLSAASHICYAEHRRYQFSRA